MIKYTVKISDKAQADMEQIYSYIAKELMSPRNDLGQYKRIADAIGVTEPAVYRHFRSKSEIIT